MQLIEVVDSEILAIRARSFINRDTLGKMIIHAVFNLAGSIGWDVNREDIKRLIIGCCLAHYFKTTLPKSRLGEVNELANAWLGYVMLAMEIEVQDNAIYNKMLAESNRGIGDQILNAIS